MLSKTAHHTQRKHMEILTEAIRSNPQHRIHVHDDSSDVENNSKFQNYVTEYVLLHCGRTNEIEVGCGRNARAIAVQELSLNDEIQPVDVRTLHSAKGMADSSSNGRTNRRTNVQKALYSTCSCYPASTAPEAIASPSSSSTASPPKAKVAPAAESSRPKKAKANTWKRSKQVEIREEHPAASRLLIAWCSYLALLQ